MRLTKLRHKAYTNQHCRCCYCSYPMWEKDPEEFAKRHSLTKAQALLLQCTAEHLLARQDGGVDTARNIAAACAFCNRARHARRVNKAPDPESYRAHVARRIAKGGWHPFKRCPMH